MRTSCFSLCGGDYVTRRWQCAPIFKPKIQLITPTVAFLLIYPALCWTPSIWPQLHRARGCWQSLQRHQGVSGMSPSPSIFRGQGFQTLLATQGVNIQSRESERNASSDQEVTPIDAEEPSHIRQLREELESILRSGDKMLTSSAIHSLHAQQPAPQQKDPPPVTRPVPRLGSWWVRFWAWVARLLGLRPRGGGAVTTVGSGDIDCPRPDFTQRLTTTWTRFLHDRMPWLLGHPIFFGRPFPWQWGDWRLPHAPVLSASMTGLGVTAARLSAGLPTVGSLLHEGLPGTQQPQTSAEGGKGSVVRRRHKRGGSATIAGGLGGVGSGSRGVGLEVDLGARHWPMQNIHIRLDGSPSSMLVLERPSSALIQPVALTSPSPLILDAAARKSQMAAVPRASSRLRPQPVEADAPLLIWPEEDHPNHEGDDHVSPSRTPPPSPPPSSPSVLQEGGQQQQGPAAVDDEADPRHYPEDPEEPGVVSLFTSFFPQEHANRSTPASRGPTDARGPSPRPAAPPSSSVPGAAQAGPTLTQPELATTSPRTLTVQNTNVGTYREGSATSASLLEDEDEEEVAAAMLQGQNETSAYGRILADLSSTEPMAVTEDVSDAVLFDGLEELHMPWAASAASLEDLDKRMVIVAVESARMVTSKAQLWRFIGEIGLSPLLAGLQKSLERQEDTQREEADLLRTQAVEALLNLMNTAMDLQVVRVAVEGRALLGRDVVSNLIDVVEAPLLLLLPKIIKPRNEEVLYRGQRAAVEVLFQTVLASDKAIQLIQEDGRLWNALVQITAEGMYPPGSSIYVTSHKLLAAIGHNEWRPKLPGQRGLRILSFDGGGTRGVLSIALLKQVMESVGKEVFETFDIICGTSTGGILAVLFGIEQNKIADAEQLYDKLVSKIFSSNPILQTTKLLVRQSYYDEGVWENVLKDMLGDMLMVDSMGRGPGSPRVFCASLSLKSNPASLWLWRNYNYAPDQKPKHGGSFRIRVRDALRATTAAPTFFSPLETEDAKYCDGAFLANNPTAVALNEARLLYPGVPVEVVVSIGTGFHKDERKADVYGWEGIVNDLINCATNTEVTHETLSVFLPKSKYFRFNPRTENFPLDEIRPERLQRMKRIAREYFWDKENKERLHALAELLRKGSGPTMPTFRSSILQYTDSRP